MMTMYRTLIGGGLALALLGTAACSDSFLEVENPTIVDAGTVDPTADAEAFARSAQQNFAAAYGWLAMYSSWFSGEALVSETFPTRNDFGRRDIPVTNGSLTGDVWEPISLARATADRVIALLQEAGGADADPNLARAALFSGFSFVLMAEHFCIGTIDAGPPLDEEMMLDSAVARFSLAITAGTAAGEADLVNAAYVGRARAHLQAGRKPEAASDAAQVDDDDFVFNLNYLDDPSNRTRLGNRIWQFTFDRGSIAPAPAWRNLDDPRVPVAAPSDAFTAQDGLTAMWVQRKFTSFATPMRLASKLEADYIAAEATGGTAMLNLIQARRAANGQPAFGGGSDAEVLVELMEQRGREFYLEGKRLGDWRRNPGAVNYVPVEGGPYHKPGYDNIGSQTCYPLPDDETSNNKNFQD